MTQTQWEKLAQECPYFILCSVGSEGTYELFEGNLEDARTRADEQDLLVLSCFLTKEEAEAEFYRLANNK